MPAMENRPLDMLYFKFKDARLDTKIPYCEIANGDFVELVMVDSPDGETKVPGITIEVDGTSSTFAMRKFCMEMEKLLGRGKVDVLGVKLATAESYQYFETPKKNQK
jgi:hypothetical protein